jgi:hypothetical protein
MATLPPRTVEDLLAWLDELPPLERVHLARLLADTKTTRDLAAAGDATIHALTREATAAAVAEQLGLSAKQVKRAVEQHYSRLRATPR